MRILQADYVLPVSSEPIKDGCVVIEGNRITRVGPSKEIIPGYFAAYIEHYPGCVITPGFVNCHSHLEITWMRGSLDAYEHDFKSWLLSLNSIRAGWTEQDVLDSATAGAIEGAAAGITCFGDIGRMGHAGIEALKSIGLRGIVFQETEFSPDNRTAEGDFANLISKFETLQDESTGLVRVGLSPHSPYTVGSRLFEMIAQYAILNRVPLSIHAAESANEDELLVHGTGFFQDFYERMELEWQSPHCSPIEYLERLGVLSARPLLAHCVNVSDKDISRIADTGSTIAHCPKSNAKFGHGYAPFEAFLDAGIATGLGSDSVASNNTCDILEESRFATFAARNRADSRRFIPAKEMLEIATLGGARALGLDSQIGTLEPGKQGDIAVVSLENTAQRPINDIEAALVFSSNARDVVATFVAGKKIYETRY